MRRQREELQELQGLKPFPCCDIPQVTVSAQKRRDKPSTENNKLKKTYLDSRRWGGIAGEPFAGSQLPACLPVGWSLTQGKILQKYTCVFKAATSSPTAVPQGAWDRTAHASHGRLPLSPALLVFPTLELPLLAENRILLRAAVLK